MRRGSGSWTRRKRTAVLETEGMGRGCERKRNRDFQLGQQVEWEWVSQERAWRQGCWLREQHELQWPCWVWGPLRELQADKWVGTPKRPALQMLGWKTPAFTGDHCQLTHEEVELEERVEDNKLGNQQAGAERSWNQERKWKGAARRAGSEAGLVRERWSAEDSWVLWPQKWRVTQNCSHVGSSAPFDILLEWKAALKITLRGCWQASFEKNPQHTLPDFQESLNPAPSRSCFHDSWRFQGTTAKSSVLPCALKDGLQIFGWISPKLMESRPLHTPGISATPCRRRVWKNVRRRLIPAFRETTPAGVETGSSRSRGGLICSERVSGLALLRSIVRNEKGIFAREYCSMESNNVHHNQPVFLESLVMKHI